MAIYRRDAAIRFENYVCRAKSVYTLDWEYDGVTLFLVSSVLRENSRKKLCKAKKVCCPYFW
jgi:hypothetical protein